MQQLERKGMEELSKLCTEKVFYKSMKGKIPNRKRSKGKKREKKKVQPWKERKIH